MSRAMSGRQDTSVQSNGTGYDLSIGSLVSHFSTPGRALRKPSTSTAASSAPLTTPPPPSVSSFGKRKSELATPNTTNLDLSGLDEDDDDGEGEGNVPDTPGKEKKLGDVIGTPGRMKRTRSAGSKNGVLTLRDQEKHIDNLKKENFNIKLKVHFLEERLAELAPDQVEAALKQNINLKIEVQKRGMELKKLKKLVLELERELARAQQAGRARELEEKLEEREREIRELRKRRGPGANEDALRAVEARNAELEEELEGVRALLEENTDEMERLRDEVESREGGGDRWRGRVREFEEENEQLRDKMDALEELVTQRNDEKEELADECEALRLELEEERRRREAENYERSESRAQVMEERDHREAIEEDLNTVRDKLAAAQIELQQKEDEIDLKAREIEELVAEHARIVDQIDDDWRGEVDETRAQVEELKDVLEQREAEAKELRMHISELEADANEINEKFEVALGHLERESEEKDAEMEAANREIEKLGEQVYVLEEENERLKEETHRLREDDAVERERLEALAAALKEKVQSYKDQLGEVNDLYESRNQEIETYRARSDELAKHIEALVDEVKRERASREQLASDLDKAEQEHDVALRREQRALEAKESALASALSDLARAQSLLAQRETDLSAVQGVLQTLEAESKKLGESHTTARFSLQLEVDRLHRDIERLEDELARARKELDEREGKSRDRDGVIDKLHAENRELASQLAAQTQARMNLSEKLDDAQSSSKSAESELSNLRTKVSELEGRLAKDQRALLGAEAQYRDQLTERNTLLLTIYQYMDKILGVDKTPKKHGQAETKPFTNFSVFHDNLITRLKQLSQIQLDFDRRCKDAEARYTDKLSDMRKQLDSRWKQLDKFEASLKTLAEAKAQWRKKLSAKEGEAEALKETNSNLQAQLISVRRPGQTDSMEVRALTARATNAERRLMNLQNQLASAEENVTTANQKTTAANSKWEARVKEYEARLKQAEEKVKRERQGGKERALELETQAKSFQRQLEIARSRIHQLDGIIRENGLDERYRGSPRP